MNMENHKTFVSEQNPPLVLSSFNAAHEQIENPQMEIVFKIKNLIGLTLPMVIGGLVSFVMPVWVFLAIVLFLVIFDSYTGVKAAKLNEKPIHPHGFRKSMEKVQLYFIIILLSNGMDVVFLPELVDTRFSFSYIISAVIAVGEFRSNLRNIGSITGVDLWTKVADRLPEFFIWRLIKKKK